MRIYDFGAATGKPITQYGSQQLTITGVVGVTGGDVQVACMHLAPGGRVGTHQATARQFFLVVRGEGWVRGADTERAAIVEDQAAFWESGEEHEAGSDTGMVVLVIEGEPLDPDVMLRLMNDTAH